jgi:dTMP kinase
VVVGRVVTHSIKHPLIALEGIDGSGKRTQAKLLVEWFGKQGFPTAAYRDFPRYENLTGKAIGAHLASKWKATDDSIDELVFQALMTVNRFEEVPDLLAALKQGPVVLDRYWGSGYAYGAANGLPKTWLENVHMLLPEPDVCLWLDIPIELSWERRPERRDRYEKLKDVMVKAKVAYAQLFAEQAAKGGKWFKLDGTGTVEEVHQRIIEKIPKSFIW